MKSLAASALALVCLGCGAEPVRDAEPGGTEPPRAAAPDRSELPKVVAFGDSLTAGFGIAKDEAYPAVLQELLDAEGYAYEVVNAGVSGETSAGGVRRLDWVLEDRDVAVLIVELGGNDGLRGLPPSEMKKNLGAILDGADERNIPVLLAGLTTSGRAAEDPYIKDFIAVYEELARERDVSFLPNFLEGVAGRPELNQGDGKHPNPAGARVVAENVLEALRPMLDAR